MRPPERGAAPSPSPRGIPELPSGASLVALVPAIADLDLAAGAAWEFARALARDGRRVALIDCYVDEPRLHQVAGEPNDDGIVDVFEYGASLSRIARAQPEGTLFFVPAGTFAPDPAALMARPRWRRLSAGFRHEEAVMLLFLPPRCLDALVAPLDGLVTLVPPLPDGRPGPDGGATPEIKAALERGIKLLGTFPGDTVDAVPAAAPEPEAAAPLLRRPGRMAGWPRIRPKRAREPTEEEKRLAAEASLLPNRPLMRRPDTGRSRRGRYRIYLLLLVLAVAAAVADQHERLGWDALLAPPLEPARAVAPGFRFLVPHAVDSLPWAVQVAQWTQLDQALVDADTIAGRGLVPMVAPLLRRGAVWYRVYAGPVASRTAADSLLAAVRAAGLDGSNSAVVALVPFSFALRHVASMIVADSVGARLRRAGIASFILGQADGSYRVYSGAYATPDQASVLDSLINSTGNAGQLGPRVGYRP